MKRYPEFMYESAEGNDPVLLTGEMVNFAKSSSDMLSGKANVTFRYSEICTRTTTSSAHC